MRHYAEEMHIPVASHDTSSLLHIIGGIIRPSKILEIGTAIGYTAILMSDILCIPGRIDTVEKDDVSAVIARANIKKAGLDDIISLIEGDALEVINCLTSRYDMIFLDAAKGQYPLFLPGCLRLLRQGGILISDNVLFKGLVEGKEIAPRKKRTIVVRLREYIKSLNSTPGLETVVLNAGDGIAISLKHHE